MTRDNWVYNDPEIADGEQLLRRVPKNPNHATFDPETGEWRPSAGAFQRNANEGMSVHVVSVLNSWKRADHSAYDPARYGAVRFPAAVVREAEAGVLRTLPTEEQEPDEVLRDAHAEVRPPTPQKDRAFWSGVRDKMIKSSVWVEQQAS